MLVCWKLKRYLGLNTLENPRQAFEDFISALNYVEDFADLGLKERIRVQVVYERLKQSGIGTLHKFRIRFTPLRIASHHSSLVL